MLAAVKAPASFWEVRFVSPKLDSSVTFVKAKMISRKAQH